MAGPQVAFELTASEAKVVAALARTNTALEGVGKRASAVAGRFKPLGAELGRFAQASGLTKVSKGLGDVARSGATAFNSMSRIVPVLGAISGAASIAGMVRLVSSWAEWGSRLGWTAQRIGIASDKLQGLQGAARLSGASAAGLNSGLQTLGQTMYDAVGGRAPEAVVMFNTLGIAFRDANGHARSVADVLPEVADKIAAIKDPYTQARIATQMFGGAADELLPFLRRGSAGIREYEEAARHYGVTSKAGVDGANRLREAQARLQLSVEGLGNSVAASLAPVLAPLLLQLAEWIATSPDVKSGIVTLSAAVQDLGAWIKGIDWASVAAGVHAFATGADHAAQMVGGWQNAIELVLALMAGRFVLGMVSPWLRLGWAIGGVVAKVSVALARQAIPEAIAAFAELKAARIAAESVEAAGGVAGAAGSGSLVRIARAAGLGAVGLATRVALPLAGGYAAHEALGAADPEDRIGSWIDQHVPGASFVDNLASKVGLGRSYAQQSAAPRGIRNNNPLNLEYVPGQAGVTGSDGRFGQYGTMADGVAASEQQLLKYQARGVDTLAKMVSKWAPPGENDTPKYIANAARWSGLDPEAKVDMHDPVVAGKVITAMARMETGRELNQNEVQMGVGLGLGGNEAPKTAQVLAAVQAAAPTAAPGAPGAAGAAGVAAQAAAAIAPAQQAALPPTQGVSRDDLQAAISGSVGLTIEHRGTPAPGTRVGVTTGGMVAMAGPRIGQANVTDATP